MYHLWVYPFILSEDKSVREVLRVCTPVPREELGYSIQSINPCYMYWAYVVSYWGRQPLMVEGVLWMCNTPAH